MGDAEERRQEERRLEDDPLPLLPLPERVAVVEREYREARRRLHLGDRRFEELEVRVRTLFAQHKKLLEQDIPERIREGLDEVMGSMTRALQDMQQAKRDASHAVASASEAEKAALRVAAAEAKAAEALATASGVVAQVKGLKVPDCDDCPAKKIADDEGAKRDREAARQEREAAARDREDAARHRRFALVIQFVTALVYAGAAVATVAWVLAQR